MFHQVTQSLQGTHVLEGPKEKVCKSMSVPSVTQKPPSKHQLPSLAQGHVRS